MRTKDLAYMAIFIALLAVCSWLAIPSAVPFTMQTFAVFMTVEMLGMKRGALTIFAYILLGAVGVPVFAEFSGGLGVVMGTTGGYLIGFIGAALVMGLLERVIKGSGWRAMVRMVAGMVVYYVFGTIWFMWVYSAQNGPVSLAVVLSWCVFPFIVPDLVKALLAVLLSARLKKHISL